MPTIGPQEKACVGVMERQESGAPSIFMILCPSHHPHTPSLLSEQLRSVPSHTPTCPTCNLRPTDRNGATLDISWSESLTFFAALFAFMTRLLLIVGATLGRGCRISQRRINQWSGHQRAPHQWDHLRNAYTIQDLYFQFRRLALT